MGLLPRAKSADASPDLTLLAAATVDLFDTPTSKGAAAIMLLGYLGEDRAMDIILEQVRTASHDDAKLELFSLAVRIGERKEHQTQLCRLLTQLQSPEVRYKAMLMFSPSRHSASGFSWYWLREFAPSRVPATV